MFGFGSSYTCPSCRTRMPRRTFAAHVCAHAALPKRPGLDFLCPGVIRSEGGGLYFSGALLLQAALRTGRCDVDALAGVIGELVQAAELRVQ